MNATRKVKLKGIKENLTCKLCLGYLVDATTIIECLHSFCKSCIINYLEKSDREEKYCPVCDVQLHATKPLTSIRSDLMLQEIVYKLVPGLFKNEMRRRREFYAKNDEAVPINPLDSGQVFDELYITSDDVMHLSMEYVTDDDKLRESTRRYLKCPAAVSIFVLKKLLQGKYDLHVDTYIDVMFGDRILPDDFLLMDVAYKYSWTKNGNKPLTLSYRIRGQTKQPIIKFERTINDMVSAPEAAKPATLEESQIPPPNKKKVCNENGSNIMPSEEIKPNQIKAPTNGLIPNGGATIPPTRPPNGKIKGRKRKHLNYSDIVIESKDDLKSLAKRLKLEKGAVKSNVKKPESDSSFGTQTQMEIISSNNSNDSNANRLCHEKEVKEVQLQISENGVMSARSVSFNFNGDDKIVYDLSKRVTKSSTPTTSTSNASPINTSHDISLTEKLLLSGNFHSKTGPSGVTEIICDKPDPISSAMKTASAKPGYVTLNIPTPKNPMSLQNGRFQNTHISNDDATTDKKKTISGQNDGSPSSGKMNDRAFSNNFEVLEKIRHIIAQRGTDGTNKMQTIPDLAKLCSNAGTSTESGHLVERQKTPGMHSLPIIAPLTNPFQQQLQRPTISNGPGKSSNGSSSSGFALPIGLNFSPASGMSVSMIPCTSTGSAANGNNFSSTATNSITILNTTPPKRTAHQTSVVNGELKFTTSPKLILPKPTGDHEASSKKPPKFFKSRRTSSPGTSPSAAHSGKHGASGGSPKHEQNDSKRKIPTSMINGNGSNGGFEPLQKKMNKERKDQGKESSPPINGVNNAIDFMKLLSSGLLAATANQACAPVGKQNASNTNTTDVINGMQGSRPLSYPSQGNDKYSHHLTALSNLAAVNSVDPLTSGLGIAAVAAAAAAASNGNNLPIGMVSVPFVTDNYCSLPFLNNLNQQKHGMTQFPYGYNFPVGGYSALGSATSLTTATTTPVNSTKLKPSNSLPSPGNNSRILNGILSGSTANNDANNDTGSTLDLSLTKSTSNMASSVQQKAMGDTNPLLVSLLNSNGSKSPNKDATNNSASTNGHTNNGDSERKSKSPLIRQLLQQREEKEKARTNSCTTTEVSCNGLNGSGGEKANDKPERGNRSVVNGAQLGEYLRNGTSDKPQNNSPTKPEMNPENKSSNHSEPKSSIPINSPKMKNDNDSNISRSSGSAKIALEKEKLLCLSAQNNNIHTVSNNHDATSKNNTNDNLDCASAVKSNGKSDNNVSSAGTELSS